MASSPKWFVIVNPTSGNGSGKRLWPKIQTELDAHSFEYDFVFTQHANHSSELVQNAVKQGFKNIICVGGDGTIHNIVNGLMLQPHCDSSEIAVGIIPIGTGNDWVRTYGISMDFRIAIETIKKGQTSSQDLGKIEIENEATKAVYFNNLAGIGFDAFVVSKVNKFKHLGAIAYLAGAVFGLFNFKNFDAEIHFDSSEREVHALMILIGLCKYSGGGMQLTKDVDPQDGLFDLSITNNFGKFDMIKNFTRLFNGKVTDSKKIETQHAKEVRVLVKNPALFIQADGELIGKGNFKVSMIPKAFTFYA